MLRIHEETEMPFWDRVFIISSFPSPFCLIPLIFFTGTATRASISSQGRHFIPAISFPGYFLFFFLLFASVLGDTG